jgi:mono/diheme cytochrome c family protein
MRSSKALLVLVVSAASVAFVGCNNSPGKPGPEPEVPRPDHILDFATLYKTNCVACHGDKNQPGPAISLANPVFLAYAGEESIKGYIANGMDGKLMPPFSQEAGGMLTPQQVEILAKGLIQTWGNPSALGGEKPPPFESSLPTDIAAGKQSYATYCARCHGANGEGDPSAKPAIGSIVDPAYLGLISDQELRNFTVAGAPGMPDWRSDNPGHPMSDQEVTNIVAWILSHQENGNTSTEQPASPPMAKHSKTPQESHP